MHQAINGQCLCKAIRYEITAQALGSGLCYCRSCQIKSGSDKLAYIAAELNAVKIHGSPQWYESIGDSGQSKQNGFCGTCGTNLFGKPSLWPHILIVYAGSLDNPNDFVPTINLWLDDAPAWACINSNLKHCNRNP